MGDSRKGGLAWIVEDFNSKLQKWNTYVNWKWNLKFESWKLKVELKVEIRNFKVETSKLKLETWLDSWNLKSGCSIEFNFQVWHYWKCSDFLCVYIMGITSSLFNKDKANFIFIK
jgi:hypothetical protein